MYCIFSRTNNSFLSCWPEKQPRLILSWNFDTRLTRVGGENVSSKFISRKVRHNKDWNSVGGTEIVLYRRAADSWSNENVDYGFVYIFLYTWSRTYICSIRKPRSSRNGHRCVGEMAISVGKRMVILVYHCITGLVKRERKRTRERERVRERKWRSWNKRMKKYKKCK